ISQFWHHLFSDSSIGYFMKSIIRLLLLAWAAVFTSGAVAQDYFRTLETPQRLQPVAPPLPEEEERYNFALGPVRFNVAAGVGFEYNDNITLADSGRKSDFILRPSLTLDGYWPLSELNTLRMSLGVSYAK